MSSDFVNRIQSLGYECGPLASLTWGLDSVERAGEGVNPGV
ncbi:MAG: hypothetical protein ACUVXD_14935 [Thermodesulfobacteriota bacterium]